MSDSSVGTDTPRTSSSAGEDKQPSADDFRPVVPQWFLDNVKTPEQIRDISPHLHLVDNVVAEDSADRDNALSFNGDGTREAFTIGRIEMEDVLDTMAALHLTDPRLQPRARSDAIILLSKMRLGYDLLDRVMVTIAQEMGSSLITVTSAELREVAEDFFRQENSYLKELSGDTQKTRRAGANEYAIEPTEDAFEYFFGNRSKRNAERSATDRNMQAVFALFDAATTTTKTRDDTSGASTQDRTSSTTASTEESGVILYMRDTLYDSPTLQRRSLCRIRDALYQRRQSGQRVTLVVGLAHTEADEEATPTMKPVEQTWLKLDCSCYLCKCGEKDSCDEFRCLFNTTKWKLASENRSLFVLEPRSVPEEWPKKRLESWPPSLEMANIQCFKRFLRKNLPGVSCQPADLLEPQFDWTANFTNEKLKYLRQLTHSEAESIVEIARRYAVGRGLRQRFICISDIESAFDRAETAARSRGLVETRPLVEEGSTDNENESQTKWRQKVAAVLPLCNEQERELLSNLVNPCKRTSQLTPYLSSRMRIWRLMEALDILKETEEEIDLDEGIVETLSRLVGKATRSTESALARSAKVTGALLYGPPGTGKTLLARVIAKQTGTAMINLDGASTYSRWIGQTEKAIAAAFSLGRKLSPCIIFIDEVDALFFRRSDTDYSWRRQALNQFLLSMDGVNQGEDAPFVLGATNRPFDLDSAFLRRMPYQIEFRLPTLEARARILRMILREEQLDVDVNVGSLATVTKGFSGSDLKNLCAQASLVCLLEQDSAGPARDGVTQRRLANRHFVKAFEMIHASVSLSDTFAIDKFKELHGTASQTTAMAKLLVDMKPSTEQDSENDEESSPQDDSPGSDAGGKVEAHPATPFPQKNGEDLDNKNIAGSQQTTAGQDSGMNSDSLAGDAKADEEPQQTVPAKHLLDNRHDNQSDQGKPNESTPRSSGEENTGVLSITESGPKPLLMPVIQPPAGCLNKQRRVYPYQSLPTNVSIRILRIEIEQSVSCAKLTDPVRCSLHTVSLDDNPEYFALSYTWGDPRTIHSHEENVLPHKQWLAPAFELECDGTTITVPTNLYTAIVSLRMHFENGSLVAQCGEKYAPQGRDFFYIWADAICINQDDQDEKAQQIPLMAQIYGKCQSVLMWLGGNEPLINKGWTTTQQTFDQVMDRLGHQASVPTRLSLGKAFDIFDKASYVDLGLDPLDEEQLLGWYLLVSRSWFTRAWVTQEWALSPEAVLICGDILIEPLKFTFHLDEVQGRGWLSSIAKTVCWRMHGELYDKDNERGDYLAGILAYQNEQDPERLFAAGGDNHAPVRTETSLLHVSLLRAMLDHEPQNYSVPRSIFGIRNVFEITLAHFRNLQCSDALDKVYAFHGLFRNEDGSAILPTPDYKKTLPEVYLEASKVMFRQIGIRLLCHREKRDTFPGELQTWALDLRARDNALFDFQTKHYRASRGMCTDADPGLVGSNVVIDGYKEGFQQLIEVLSSLPEVSDIPASSKQEKQGSPVRMTRQTRFEVLWRTLLFDQSDTQEFPLPSRFGAQLKADLQDTLHCLMNHLINAVAYEMLLPLAKNDKSVLDLSTRSGRYLLSPDFCSTCAFKKELAVMVKTEGVAVRSPAIVTREIFECWCAISKLNGDIPFDSSERPEPPLWQAYLFLAEEMRKAAEEEDEDRVAAKLDELRGLVSFAAAGASEESVYIRNRKLFATSQGRLGATGDVPIQAGDEVWVLAGLPYPVILREAGDGTYFVVMCAYVHGIMHGEALSDSEAPVLVTLT
ncbi:ATPase family associated with various cellular activities (AAA) domain-containing protein [Sarocladium implicatum]|nr:ATPase family associated with various cellular activities (AAA) domain-containing protein [Sarocladium implicatum]